MEKVFFGPKNFHKVLSTMVQAFFGPKNSQSCSSHCSVLFSASFSLIWVKTPLPLVLSGWYKYQNEAFASQNVFLEHLEWLSENCGYWFLGPRSFTALILSLFWALLWRFQPNLCENQLPLFRSGWFKHKKRKLSTVRMCFQNIWSDWVKIAVFDFLTNHHKDKKNSKHTSSHIERWILRLQPFDFWLCTLQVKSISLICCLVWSKLIVLFLHQNLSQRAWHLLGMLF